jgi:hypothetical protein
MNTAKELAQSILRSGAEFATKATTCRRLAGGIAAVDANFLGLTDKQRATLAGARALLDEIAGTYAKAAKLKKQQEEARKKREQTIRAAMKSTFEALDNTADKVALIAFVSPWAFDAGSTVTNIKDAADAHYLFGQYLRDQLNDLAYAITRRAADSAPPAEAVAAEWARFQEVRGKLQDKHARVIVTVDRLLAGAQTGGKA